MLRSEGPTLNSHGREAVCSRKARCTSAAGAALVANQTSKSTGPPGPRLHFEVLVHGLTAAATECRAFGALVRDATNRDNPENPSGEVILIATDARAVQLSNHLVFVYGTLRRGGPGAMSLRFRNAKFIAEATVCGSLYDLGAYPGLLVDGSSGIVVGEVYEVDDETLKKLDGFEASSHYYRKQVAISLDGDSTIGWTYEPNPDVYSFSTLITSGDWIEYSSAADRP